MSASIRISSGVRRLLRCALHPLGSLGHPVLIFFLRARCTLCSPLSTWVDFFQFEIVNHGIMWWLSLLPTGRKDVLEHLDLLGAVEAGFWELDVELDIQVAKVVVSHGGHALAANHFDLACLKLALVNKRSIFCSLPGLITSPGSTVTVNQRSSRCSI